MDKLRWILMLLIASPHYTRVASVRTSQGSLKLVAVECESLDQNFMRFDNCNMSQLTNREMALNIKAQLLQEVQTIAMDVKLLRQVNRKYKPFLYDDVIDFCDFLTTSSKRQMFWDKTNQMLLKYSNINHSCPYNHDIIIKNFIFEKIIFRLVPLPRGIYMIQVLWTLNNVPRLKILMYSARA